MDRRAAVAPSQVQAPIFEVDPLWPKPLPNHWVLGWTVGVTVDPEDHIWIVHQATKLEAPELWGAAKESSCCFAAPPVLEFDQAGNLLSHWGGPGAGYDWMDNPHGVYADAKGNIWMGGNGQGDSQILKFTQSGKFLLQIGRPNMSKGSNDLENVNKGTKVWVDDAANEAYVSDGYSNRRLVVFDATTGNYKRHWGAYGTNPMTRIWETSIRTSRPSNNSGSRFTASPCRTTGWFTCATARTTVFRSFERMAPSSPSSSGRNERWATGPLATSPSRETRNRSTCMCPIPRTKRSTSSIA